MKMHPITKDMIARLISRGVRIRELAVNWLVLHWYFSPKSEPSNDMLEVASKAGLDPLEIIRSYHYNLNKESN
jgi:hypothetical protein